MFYFTCDRSLKLIDSQPRYRRRFTAYLVKLALWSSWCRFSASFGFCLDIYNCALKLYVFVVNFPYHLHDLHDAVQALHIAYCPFSVRPSWKRRCWRFKHGYNQRTKYAYLHCMFTPILIHPICVRSFNLYTRRSSYAEYVVIVFYKHEKQFFVRLFKHFTHSYAQYIPPTPTRLSCRVKSRRRCVHNSQLVGDSLDESERFANNELERSRVASVLTHPSTVRIHYQVYNFLGCRAIDVGDK